jgi:hypothetical protein
MSHLDLIEADDQSNDSISDNCSPGQPQQHGALGKGVLMVRSQYQGKLSSQAMSIKATAFEEP